MGRANFTEDLKLDEAVGLPRFEVFLTAFLKLFAGSTLTHLPFSYCAAQ
jgi:hypothetical protein